MKRALLLATCVMLVTFGCKTGENKVAADLAHLTRRAEKGNPRTQYELGAEYARLWNHAEASRWYRKAAEQGDRDAQYALGQNYANGDGVVKDFVEAYAWFSLAAAQGSRVSMNARDRLTRSLSRQEIEEGNRRAFHYITGGAAPESVKKRLIQPASPVPSAINPITE